MARPPSVSLRHDSRAHGLQPRTFLAAQIDPPPDVVGGLARVAPRCGHMYQVTWQLSQFAQVALSLGYRRDASPRLSKFIIPKAMGSLRLSFTTFVWTWPFILQCGQTNAPSRIAIFASIVHSAGGIHSASPASITLRPNRRAHGLQLRALLAAGVDPPQKRIGNSKLQLGVHPTPYAPVLSPPNFLTTAPAVPL